MISIQFIDFQPERGTSPGVESQMAALNAWVLSRPDVNVVTIETILMPSTAEEDSYLIGKQDLLELPQVIRLWYEGDQ